MDEFHWIDSKILPKDDRFHLLAIKNRHGGIEFDYGFYSHGDWNYRGVRNKEVVAYTAELFNTPDFYNIIHSKLKKEIKQ